jgi:hypothetical protein
VVPNINHNRAAIALLYRYIPETGGKVGPRLRPCCPLPIGGAQNAGMVRNRTRRAGEKVVGPHATEKATQTTDLAWRSCGGWA